MVDNLRRPAVEILAFLGNQNLFHFLLTQWKLKLYFVRRKLYKVFARHVSV